MPRKKMTEEEKIERQIEGNLKSQLSRLRKSTINTPTIIYNVGDRVKYGNHTKTKITEVLDNYKIYRIHNVTDKLRYGKPITEISDYYVKWTDILPYRTISNNDKIPILSYMDDVSLSYFSSELRSLLYIYYDKMNMLPEYQRGNVWDNKDNVALIDSIFNNIEIGKFVIIRLPYEENQKFRHEILDGKQRLNALMLFFEGRIKYKGLLFRDLHRMDQYHFLTYLISMALFEGKMTDKQKYKYFLKLNVAGKVQDPKHIEYVKGLLKG